MSGHFRRTRKSTNHLPRSPTQAITQTEPHHLENSSIMCIYRPGFYAICPHCFNRTFHPHSPPARVDRYFFRYDQEFLDRHFPHGLPRDIIACPCESDDMWLWDVHPPRRADAEFTRYCSRCLRRAREHADQTGSTPDWYSRDAGDNPERIFFVDRRRLPRRN